MERVLWKSQRVPFAFWQKMWIFGHFRQFSAKGPPFAKKCEISKGYPLCILTKKCEFSLIFKDFYPNHPSKGISIRIEVIIKSSPNSDNPSLSNYRMICLKSTVSSPGVWYSAHTCYFMDWNGMKPWTNMENIFKMSKNRIVSRTFETLKKTSYFSKSPC